MLIVDPGNSYYKVTDGKRELIYPAVIGEAQDVWTESKPWQVDSHYIGEDALNYSRFHSYSLELRANSAPYRSWLNTPFASTLMKGK